MALPERFVVSSQPSDVVFRSQNPGSVLVGPLGALTRGGTEHFEVDIPAMIKIQGVHSKLIRAFWNDFWCF